MKENIFYIYCHRKKTDGKCFYIGKGKKNRHSSKSGRNQHWWNIVNKHGFETEILVNNVSEQKAFELESYFCTQVGYENLCNIRTENGWGGYTMSEKTKKILSNKLKGRHISASHKEKISISNTGKKRSEEFKKQIKQRQTGHSCYKSPERNQKISRANTGRKHSQETINKMKKPKPEGFGEKYKNRKVTWGNKISQNRTGKGEKPVIQYDKQGNIIAIFPSVKKAAEYVGVNPINMSHHLNGKYKTCKNFIFKYYIK